MGPFKHKLSREQKMPSTEKFEQKSLHNWCDTDVDTNADTQMQNQRLKAGGVISPLPCPKDYI